MNGRAPFGRRRFTPADPIAIFELVERESPSGVWAVVPAAPIRTTVYATVLILVLALLAGCTSTGYSPQQIAEFASQVCEQSGHRPGTAEHFHCASGVIHQFVYGR